MKILFLFAALVCAIFPQKDFRNSNWGDLKSQVKKTEKKKIVYEDNINVTCEDYLLTYDVTVGYRFNNDNRLHEGLYIFNISHLSPELYFHDFEAIKSNVSIRYGDGSENEKWNNDLFKDSPGTAL